MQVDVHREECLMFLVGFSFTEFDATFGKGPSLEKSSAVHVAVRVFSLFLPGGIDGISFWNIRTSQSHLVQVWLVIFAFFVLFTCQATEELLMLQLSSSETQFKKSFESSNSKIN